ncbi:hypothetical protein ACOMCU_15790 [Lysinibacillus sp. UGB7]|uniref:hypothetical protein n=1 Tax=Lysinibacillus sp. UGB7 TaxID=3411039 RepID=UPI003B7D19CD
MSEWLVSFDEKLWLKGFYEFESYEDAVYSICHIGALRLYNEWLDFIGSIHIEVSESLALNYCVVGRIENYKYDEETGLDIPIMADINFVFRKRESQILMN